MDHLHRKKDGVTQIGLDNSGQYPRGHMAVQEEGWTGTGRWSVTEDDVASVGSHIPWVTHISLSFY